MRLLHLTDLHYRTAYPASQEEYLHVLAGAPPMSRRLELCRRRLGHTPVDGILLTGDLTDYGEAEDFRALRALVDRVFPGIPMAVTPGNHDGEPAFQTGWNGAPASPRPWNRLFWIGPLAVLSLDSSREGSNGGLIDEDQCRWLEEQLAWLGDAPAILITHFHLLPGQHSMPPAAYHPRFFQAAARSRLLGIFCGHAHEPFTGFFAGKPYYTAPSLSFHGVRSAQDALSFGFTCGYGLYTIHPTGAIDSRFEVFQAPSVFL